MSVAELLAAGEGPETLSVVGYLFVYEDGSMVLADALAESFPPQPGAATVAVEGVNLQTVPLEEPPADSELASVRWTAQPIELLGSLSGGVFFGSTPAST